MRIITLRLTLMAVLAVSASGALADPPEPRAQTTPAPEASGMDEETGTPDTAPPDTDTDLADEDGDALHSGGPGNTSPRGPSLQEAMRACDGLSGSASARCQEQVLADHPGEF